MKAQHINPEEAVKIHQDIKSKFSLGIHWGTFILTMEPEDDPPKVLKKELEKVGLPSQQFITTHIGETFKIGTTQPRE
jgi:N-acyl-phosphatidylethanolamine-hydrolysing phospholipase D